jgi:predicted ATPase
VQPSRAPFLERVFRRPDREFPDASEFPFCVPFVSKLDLRIRRPVTFFVGENGSGKSTLLECIATFAGLPASGGGRNELNNAYTPENETPLSSFLRPAFRAKPAEGYFLRAEYQAHFAQLLDGRRDDPDFLGDPYQRYGGRSLLTRSHGEAFLAVIQSFSQGIFLLDEPEAALSPQRQLALMTHMLRLVRTGRAQFIVATHSPILMTFPESQIVDFNVPELPDTTLTQTDHYHVTTGILSSPERYWKHLAADPRDDTD